MMDVYSDDQSCRTRITLIQRLGDRLESDWQQFFDTYWRLIYHEAQKKNLSPADCEEVVQDTIMAIFKNAESFRYDPAKGKFRSYLMTVTRNKINDRYRQLYKEDRMRELNPSLTHLNHSSNNPNELESEWGEEWKKNILHAAMDNIKKKINPKHFQVFYFLNFEDLSPKEVSQFLKINRMQIYIINFRVKKALTDEARRLEKEFV